MKRRLLNLLIAIDQLLWVALTLGNGYPDETISAAMWRLEQEGRWVGRILRPLIDLLFFFHKDHCENAFHNEIGNIQLPEKYRRKD